MSALPADKFSDRSTVHCTYLIIVNATIVCIATYTYERDIGINYTFYNSGLHSGHNMMRISAPDLVWPQHFFRRLVKLHDRMNRRAASANGGATGQDDPTAADVGEEEPRLPAGGSCRAPRPQGPGRHQGGGALRHPDIRVIRHPGHHGGRNPFSPPTAGAPHQGGAFRPPFAGQLE